MQGLGPLTVAPHYSGTSEVVDMLLGTPAFMSFVERLSSIGDFTALY